MKEHSVYFQFRKHPGDLFRNTDVIELPDPIKDQETFWVWFHPCYQDSNDISSLNRLYKAYYNEYETQEELHELEKDYGSLSDFMIVDEIKQLEAKINTEAFETFYRLVASDEIRIIGGKVNA